MIIAPMRPDTIRTDMGEYVLSVRDLRAGKSVAGVDVKRGAIVAIAGTDAARALATIAGLRRERSGSVRFLGYEVARRSPDRLARNGLVLAGDPAPFAHMSVLDTVTVGALARTRSVKKAQAAAHEILALLDLTDVADRLGAQLGARDGRRLAIARAVATRPILLLVAGACDGGADERALTPAMAQAIVARGTSLLLAQETAATLAGMTDDVVMLGGERID